MDPPPPRAPSDRPISSPAGMATTTASMRYLLYLHIPKGVYVSGWRRYPGEQGA